MWVIRLVSFCCVLAWNVGDSLGYSSITADSLEVFANQNEPAIFFCNIIGDNLTEFTWVKTGYDSKDEILDNSKTNRRWINETHGTMEIYFENVTAEDYGSYKCVAGNNNLTISSYGRLVPYRRGFNWTVDVLHQESIDVKWDWIEDLLQAYSFRIEYRENGTDEWLRTPVLSTPEKILRDGSFTINKLKPFVIYEVKCVLFHEEKQSSELRYHAFSKWVVTYGRGRIFAEANAVIARPNERAVLSCVVIGEVKRVLEWQRNGKIFDKNPTNVWWINKTYGTVELEFANVTPDDAGEYECWVESTDTLVVSTAKLEVKNFADVPAKVKAIGTNDVYIIWNYRNMIGKHYNAYVKGTIEYKESGTNKWHQAGRIFNSSTDLNGGHTVIEKLKKHTLYQIKNVFEIRERRSHAIREIFVHSEWTTTFEKEVNYVPTVEILNKTVDTVTIKWSQPPPELQGLIDAYLISVQSSDGKGKYFSWSKYDVNTRRAIVYIAPSSSYALVVRACFGDFCPDRHASVVIKGVTTNDTAGADHSFATVQSESDKMLAFLSVHVTPNAEDATAGSGASLNCSVKVRGLGGWWSREGESVTFSTDADNEMDSTIIVGDAQGGENGDYTCSAKMSNDLQTGGRMLVTLIR